MINKMYSVKYILQDHLDQSKMLYKKVSSDLSKI